MIQIPYKPREEFLGFHNRSQKYSLMVCHRRMGKTVACVNDLVIKGLQTKKKNARYAYVATFRQQAKEIAWSYLKEATADIRIEAPRESELRVKLPGDVWITLYGADNPDAMRGLYFDGIVLDEFGDMKPSLMGEVVLPCLADRDGWLAIIGTAKGRNQFYHYKNDAENDDEWFYQMSRASETGLLPADRLESLKKRMAPEKYAQEMECDFDAALPGTFYTDLMNKLEQDGQMVEHDLFNPDYQVEVAADLGLRDSTAWWFWQPDPEGGFNVIDYYEADGVHVDHYLEMLASKPYEFKHLWLPHDSRAKTLATRRSTMEQFRVPSSIRPDLYDGGFVYPVRMTPKLSIQHGIDAVRMILPHCKINKVNCERGIDCLRGYRRNYNESLDSFSDTPVHDWASNGADGFRYLALVAQDSQPRPAMKAPRQAKAVGNRGGEVFGRGYTLDDLFAERESKGRSGIIRI